MQEISEDEIASAGFRWHASGTQSGQDRILGVYERFLRCAKVLPDVEATERLTEEEKDFLMFPKDERKLTRQLRNYVIFVANHVSGKSQDNLTYQTLSKYRAALVFWVEYIFNKHFTPKPARSVVYNRITESLRFLAKKLGLTRTSQNPNKSEVGLAELRQTFGTDLANTPEIAVADGQQLAMCLMRICSIRPGSIGWSNQENKGLEMYLKWQDIDITRGDVKGSFDVVTFRILKSSLDDHERAMNKPENLRIVRAKIPSPRSHDHFIFSVAHGALAMALRLKYIEGIDSIDELLNGDSHHIKFKQEALNRPVVRAAGARGLTTTDEPASAASLSEYLARRGQWLGYSQPINYTSIRRRAGTELSLSVGVDEARRIMNHDPDSRTLEKYYLNLSGFTDMNAVGLGLRGTAEDQSDRLARENHPLAIGAIINDPDAIIRLHGAALNAALAKLLADYGPLTGTAKEQDNTRRRLRNAAKKAVLDDEVQKMRASLSHVEYNRRVQMLSQSDFTSLVLQKAKEAMKDPATVDDADDSLYHDNGFFKQSTCSEDPAEEDLDEQVSTDEPKEGRVGHVLTTTSTLGSPRAGRPWSNDLAIRSRRQSLRHGRES